VKGGGAKAACLAAGGVLAGFLMGEAALAVLDKPHFLAAPAKPAQFFPVTLESGAVTYVSSPSTSIPFVYDGNPRGYFEEGNVVRHTTNSQGFRGRDFTREKRSRLFRIAFLGDSLTFGEGVRDADTYPEQTAVFLDSSNPSLPWSFESYNFGVGGYNTGQELVLLKEVASSFRPDMAVVGYSLNDAEPQLFTFDPATRKVLRWQREDLLTEGAGAGDLRPPGSILYSLRIPRVLWKAWARWNTSQETTAHYRSLYEPPHPGWDAAMKALGEMKRYCDGEGLRFLVVIFPVLFRLDETYPFRAAHAAVTEFLDDAGIDHIDLLEILRDREDTSLWVHPTDQHPNEKVHRIAALELAARIGTMLSPPSLPDE